jgi:hypothetical protein
LSKYKHCRHLKLSWLKIRNEWRYLYSVHWHGLCHFQNIFCLQG